MNKDALEHFRTRWRAAGLIKVKNVFSRAEQDKILDDIEEITGMTDADLAGVQAGKKEPFVAPGTLVRNKVFWPIIHNENILKLMHLFVGDDIKFQGADALSVHWVNQGLHRDSHVDPSHSPDWDPDNNEFRIGRFLTYLNREGAPPNTFYFVPFSHVRSGDLEDQGGMEFQDVFTMNVPVILESGDCLVFDPRILHSGGNLAGPKHMISMTYGVPNEHLVDTYFYGRIVRVEEGYTDAPAELVEELRSRNIFLEASVDPAQWKRFEEIYAGGKSGDNAEAHSRLAAGGR